MFHSQLSHKLFLAAAAAGLLAVAGCSNQPETTASNQASKPAKASSKAASKAACKAAASKAEAPKVTPVSAKVSQPTGHTITVPKGTPITAVVDQTLHSDKSHQGDTFAASLAAPVKVNGKTVLPKGAQVTGKVVTVKKNELKVQLASVTLHGRSYDLQTNTRRPSDKVKTASAKSSDKGKEKTKEKKTDNSTL